MKNFISLKHYLLVLISVFGLLASSCQKEAQNFSTADQFSGDVSKQWYELSIKLTQKTTGFVPPIASRAFGYIGVALYESVVAGMPNNASLSGQLNGLQVINSAQPDEYEYNWSLAANAAMAYMVKNLYANTTDELKAEIEALEESLYNQYSAQSNPAVNDRSVNLGTNIAEQIYNWSKTDGGHEAYNNLFPTSFQLPVGPQYWVPTAAGQKPLLPYWGDNRPFIAGCTAVSQPAPPAQFSTEPNSNFYQQAYEVYTTGQNLTDEETIIANYWADGGGTVTPPGHSISILKQLLSEENADIAKCADAYCKMGIAVSDAFVSCWKCKYQYNLLRPLTYINQYIDPEWTTSIGTPPFPEYTSGHSVQSGAAQIILEHLFGANKFFTDNTHATRTDINGTPRSFNSFDAFAQEAAISRLYGGIHYRDAIAVGVAQGKSVGQMVLTLPFLQ